MKTTQETQQVWKAGVYDDPEKPLRCRHKGTPAEPYGRSGQYGVIRRITPAARGLPAQAFVDWGGEYTTWEKLSALSPV